MIILRQGEAKNIPENFINNALTAVETYNRPCVQFIIENDIILMLIAWTKLFHAYFQSEIGERYFYKEKELNIDLASLLKYLGNKHGKDPNQWT